MWTVPGKPVSVKQFEPFEPEERLYEFDGPRIFTVRDADGELCLAYWSDEDESVCRYVVVPTTLALVERLKQGRINIHDALHQPRCWLCDRSHDGELIQCQRLEFEDIPADALPAPGALLLPSLEPPELTREAIRILCRELGVANAYRFVTELSPGHGNYTEERRQLYAGKTVDEIADEVEAWKRAEATTAE